MHVPNNSFKIHEAKNARTKERNGKIHHQIGDLNTFFHNWWNKCTKEKRNLCSYHSSIKINLKLDDRTKFLGENIQENLSELELD